MSKKPKASTQEHLDLEDIQDDLVILKSGWVSLVISTTSLNFDLLSEAEQDATIYAYGAFLNSLTFPVQILVRSKKADISAYFALLSEAEGSQANPDLKKQIQKYRDFLTSIIQQKTVLDKSFYLIVNYNPLERGVKAGLGKTNVSGKKNKIQLLTDAKGSLFPKRDHVIKQIGRLGLTATQLTTKELIELFYDIYNPAPTGTQRVILDSASYTVPIVEPAVEVPTASANAPGGAVAPQVQQQNPSPQTQSYQPLNFQQQAGSESQVPPPSQPALPQIAQDENLRPVPPQPAPVNIPQIPPIPQENTAQKDTVVPPAPQPASQNISNQQSSPPSQPSVASQQNAPSPQLDALKSLQEATAKAAQYLNQSNAQPAPTQPQPNVGGQSQK